MTVHLRHGVRVTPLRLAVRVIVTPVARPTAVTVQLPVAIKDHAVYTDTTKAQATMIIPSSTSTTSSTRVVLLLVVLLLVLVLVYYY